MSMHWRGGGEGWKATYRTACQLTAENFAITVAAREVRTRRATRESNGCGHRHGGQEEGQLIAPPDATLSKGPAQPQRQPLRL